MRIIRTIAELRRVLDPERAAGRTVGFVPTMGALHDGHLSLVKRARVQTDVVVLSIFVNPTQFNEPSDLAAYPRQEAQDAAIAEGAGVEVIFAPAVEEMYPDGFATLVRVTGTVSETLEGFHRSPSHFDGMATIVAKLLLAVEPHLAYFGQKDAQQLIVVRRMVKDLGIPTQIIACPTLRDPDGLAMSSRNSRLSDVERQRALAIPRSLSAITATVASGEHETAVLAAIAEGILASQDLRIEYVAFVNPTTLERVQWVDAPVLCAIAARVGDVRLIDNAVLEPKT